MNKKLIAVLIAAAAATAGALGIAGCTTDNGGENGGTAPDVKYSGTLAYYFDGKSYSVSTAPEDKWTDNAENLTELTIPSEYEGTPVTRIGTLAGDYTSIIIPDSITQINTFAFIDCEKLESVTIGNGVTTISSELFYNMDNIKSVTLGSGVKEIESRAFYGCSGLTAVTLPDSVTAVEYQAFYGCENLKTATIGNNVTEIAHGTFEGCALLESIVIPNKVTKIGDTAFGGCEKLTEITIPANVTAIGTGAFKGCAKLTEITIPASVKQIGTSAFYGCNTLEHITVNEGNETYKSVTDCLLDDEGKTLILGCKNSVIPAGVELIASNAFYGYAELTEISIPKSVTEIGDNVFGGCEQLSAITYYGTVAEWKELKKGAGWFTNKDYTIQCSDDKLVYENGALKTDN